jgi:CelD/BcsL family acetyltransferase involved in cellulose biosynthesis
VEIVQIKKFSELSDLGVDWNSLLMRSADNTVFQTLEWLDTWWMHYGQKRELITLIAKENNEILAIAPLMKSTYNLFGLKLKRIEFVGSPSADYQNFILLDKPILSVKMFLKHILENFDWDIIDFKNIPQESQTAQSLIQLNLPKIGFRERSIEICSSVFMPQTFDDYIKSLGKATRKNLPKWERRLSREHRVEYKTYRDFDSIDAAMRFLFELHQKRHQSRGEAGLFSNGTFRNFHLDIAKEFAKKDWLQLGFLTIDGKPVSAEYGFAYNSKMFFYLNGFDPAYEEKHVGHLGTKCFIKKSFDLGLKEFDFMRGEHAYKKRWNTVQKENITVESISNRPIPMMYDFLSRISGNGNNNLFNKLRNYVSA